MIWHNSSVTVEILNEKYNKGLSKHLDMSFVELGDDFLKMNMMVSHQHHQPFGVLHGGASVVAAETVGSCAANLVIDTNQFMAVGQSINANHLSSFIEGELEVIGSPIHLGKRSHVWEIKISDAKKNKLVCISRLTMAIIPRSKK